MNKEIIKEIGERINNGEDLIIIKADLNSRGIEFNQYDNFSFFVDKNQSNFNFSKFIQDNLISFCFNFGLASFFYNLSEITSIKLYLLLLIILFFLYYKYLKFYILEFAYDLNRYLRIIILIVTLYFISNYHKSYVFNKKENNSELLNSINTN